MSIDGAQHRRPKRKTNSGNCGVGAQMYSVVASRDGPMLKGPCIRNSVLWHCLYTSSNSGRCGLSTDATNSEGGDGGVEDQGVPGCGVGVGRQASSGI